MKTHLSDDETVAKTGHPDFRCVPPVRVGLITASRVGPSSEFRYNETVRRLISIALLLVFSFPLFSPVLALAASSDANLPACCRRNGAHHCVMKLQQTESSGPGISLSAIPQRCPAYPAVITSVQHRDLSLYAASLIFAEIVSHPSVRTQTQARARVALDRSSQKRGPPSDLL